MTVRGRCDGTLLPLPRLTDLISSDDQAKPAKMSPREECVLSFFEKKLTAANLSVGRAPLDVRADRPRGRPAEKLWHIGTIGQSFG